MQVAHPHGVLLVEGMARPDADHEALVVETAGMEALVDLFGLAVDRDIELALRQSLLELAVGAVLHDQPHPGMALAEGLQERHEAARPDGAHHAELQLDIVELGEAFGALLGGVGLDQHLRQMRTHHLAEAGQMRVVALAAEQRPAQLVLEALDGAGQRRLGDVAGLRRAREVQGLADREEVADLMHFHGKISPASAPIDAPLCPRSS